MNIESRDIKNIVKGKPITDEWPWNTGSERSVTGHIKKSIAEINRKLNLKAKTEFDHYGSGYSSFIDCFLYCENRSTKVVNVKNGFTGIVVLFSRLSNFYTYGEGDKIWHAKGGSSYLPNLQMIGNLKNMFNLELINYVKDILAANGWRLLEKDDANQNIGFDISIPTILSDPPFKIFDAIFYWED